MAEPPLIVCPVDFSDASRTALQYGCAIADHFGARLIVLSVDDPLLSTVASTRGEPLAAATERELRRFIDGSLPQTAGGPKLLDVQVAVGKPAPEIVRVAREHRADLVVMSSHGRSGTSKRFFGSTTEGVLRTTDVPVLVTPRTRDPIGPLSAIAQTVRRIVVPVDLSPASPHQIRIAAGIARALSIPLLLPYVLEPVFVPPEIRWAIPGLDAERRAQAEASLQELVARHGAGAAAETLILTGDASEEIVKLARARDAGLIVMGLHSSDVLGPRMGSVTYRVLSMIDTLVLALPPTDGSSSHRAGQSSLTASNR
jgi:universal stress protein A